MKSFNTKLILSMVGIAMLATPAFAQRPNRHHTPGGLYSYQTPVGGTYPNPVVVSGSAELIQSGAAFNTGY